MHGSYKLKLLMATELLVYVGQTPFDVIRALDIVLKWIQSEFDSVFFIYVLGGCPFNGPLSGTKYPTRAASPIQNASTPKSSLPFSKHRSCALLCAVVRRF